MNWNGCERNRSRPNVRYYPGICLEGLKKTTKPINEDSRSLSSDLNLGPPKYEAWVLTSRLRRSVPRFRITSLLQQRISTSTRNFRACRHGKNATKLVARDISSADWSKSNQKPLDQNKSLSGIATEKLVISLSFKDYPKSVPTSWPPFAMFRIHYYSWTHRKPHKLTDSL
jgi:hypothetical protein